MSVITNKATREKIMLYRRVFGTPEGRKVLSDILLDLSHFGTSIEDDMNPEIRRDKIVLQDYAKLLLFKIGAFTDSNVDLIVDSYINLPIQDSPAPADKEID